MPWKDKLAYDTSEPVKHQKTEPSLQDISFLSYPEGKTSLEKVPIQNMNSY